MPRGAGANEPWEYIYLASLIKQHIGELFPGLILDGVHAFRVTRNSDLYIDDEEAENLLRTIEHELRRTSRGNAVRLEVETDCPKDFLELLLEFFDLTEADPAEFDFAPEGDAEARQVVEIESRQRPRRGSLAG